MKQISLYLPCLGLIGLLITGCESNGIANRINERSAVFASLTPEDKASLEEGLIFPGYSADMTYIALGKPSSIETKQDNEKTVEVWAYKKFYPSEKLENILMDYAQTRDPDLFSTSDRGNQEVMKSDNSRRLDATRNHAYGKSHTANSSRSMGSLSLPDVPVYNLFLFFVENKIIDIQFETLDGIKF